MNISKAFAEAEQLKSKIPQEYIEKLTGLSSPKIWHLLNNLAAQAESYFEVGTHMGSTLMAAMYGNSVSATAVDNFCMKPKTRGHFFHNVKGMSFTFIERDCWEIKPESVGPFDLYFYDGEHSYESQYKAISHFLPAMKKEFVYVVDDWNNASVQEGTFKAIEDCGLDIVEMEERKNKLMKDTAGWWCGICCIKIIKK